MTLKALTRFAAQQFGADVTIVQNDEDIVAWRKANLDRLHVLLFSNLKEPPSSFEVVAAFLKRTAVFAFGAINQLNIGSYPRALGSLTLDELPTYVIYRMGNPRDDTFGGPVTPIVAPMDLDAGILSAVIRRYHFPVFAEVNQGNIDRLCADYCVIFVLGVELAEDIKRGVNDMNIPTAVINMTTESSFTTTFGLDAGDFIVLKRKSSEYVIWKEITTWMTFRRKFELMNNGIGGFKHAQRIPEFVGVSVDSHDVAKSHKSKKWEALRSRLIDTCNQLYAKLMTLPVPAVVIGLILVLIGIGELLVCCFGACWRCIRPKAKVHDQ
jgi:hypothetical protein